MSGFDDLPGFGAPPPFLSRQPVVPGLSPSAPGFGAPANAGFGAPASSFGAPASSFGGGGFDSAPIFQQAPHPPQHHMQQFQQPQPTTLQQQSQQPGSLFGAAPMIGGNSRHNYTPKSYDLPQDDRAPRQGFGAAPPPFGSHASAPQAQRFPPAASAASREATNTVWLGFQDSFSSEDDLRRHFAQYGKVLRVQRNQMKNCVFVHYLEVDEARRAVDDPATRQFLGPTVKISYGRMFTYDAEELERMERFDQARLNRGGGGGGAHRHGGIGFGEEARDPNGASPSSQPPPHFASSRPPRQEAEPTNIVWVGDVSLDITDDILRMNFSSFGRVVSVNRADSKGMAFVHMESVEAAAQAIRALRSVPIAGRVLKLNFGRPMGPRGGDTGRDDDSREPPTNVIWLGMLAPSVTQGDIDALFQGYEGFIDADLFPDRAYAFGHFETVEQALKCRQALRGQSLHGVQVRVGFGKQNHTRTRGGASGAFGQGGDFSSPASSAPAFDQYGNPLLQPPSGGDPFMNGGALVTTVGSRGELQLLPAEGAAPTVTAALVPKYVTRTRPTPQVTLESRVHALGGCSYFKCNVPAPYLMQPAVKEIVETVDNVTSSASAEQLLKTLKKHDAPTTLPHLCAVVTKRIKDYHLSDPHRKLHIAYAFALMLHEMPLAKARGAYEAFCTLLAAVAIGQCNDGAAHLFRLMKSFRKYLNPDVEADATILGHFEEIEKKHRADSDVSNLLKKLQASKNA